MASGLFYFSGAHAVLMPGKDVVKIPVEKPFLKVELEPKGDPDKYFTDEKPSFTFLAENITDKKVYAELILRLQLNKRTQEFVFHEEIESGETLTEEITTELLTFQDSGYIGLVSCSDFEEKEDKIEIRKNDAVKPASHPLYTFTVWDREFYKSDYVRPRRAQYISALLSLCIVAVGVMQLLFTA